MPRKKTTGLTDAELRIMNVLWDAGEATVTDVQKALKKHRFAYTTILTLMQVLESKGYVDHTPAGRAYRYRPLIGREQMRRGALQRFLATWFDASANALVANLLDENELDPEELAKAVRRRK